MSVKNRILRRIQAKGRGAVFTPVDFTDLGSRSAVDQTLSRLARDGPIRRLDRGLYDYPRRSRRVGDRSPDPDLVAQAVARKLGARLQRSGAWTANVLGLSTHVPAQVVYLTDGPSRTISAGNIRVTLRHAGPRSLLGAGTATGDVYQALRFLGRNGIDQSTVDTLRGRLTAADRSRLGRDLRRFPAWMRSVVAQAVAA